MNYSTSLVLTAGFLLLAGAACKKDDETSPDTSSDEVVVNVNQANFLSGGLSEAVSVVSRTLSDGTTADCYKIVVKSIPTDHAMGPWCPTNITDDASKGGIWLENGNVYDVDGAFMKNLATFYNDNTWMMYNASTGVITKTKTQADCAAAANPNVGAEYKNYCVECLPSYVASLTHTYYLPVTPKKAATRSGIRHRPGHGPSRHHGRPQLARHCLQRRRVRCRRPRSATFWRPTRWLRSMMRAATSTWRPATTTTPPPACRPKSRNPTGTRP